MSFSVEAIDLDATEMLERATFVGSLNADKTVILAIVTTLLLATAAPIVHGSLALLPWVLAALTPVFVFLWTERRRAFREARRTHRTTYRIRLDAETFSCADDRGGATGTINVERERIVEVVDGKRISLLLEDGTKRDLPVGIPRSESQALARTLSKRLLELRAQTGGYRGEPKRVRVAVPQELERDLSVDDKSTPNEQTRTSR